MTFRDLFFLLLGALVVGPPGIYFVTNRGVRAGMKPIHDRIDSLRSLVDAHVKRPFHEQAGEDIRAMRAELSDHKADADRRFQDEGRHRATVVRGLQRVEERLDVLEAKDPDDRGEH